MDAAISRLARSRSYHILISGLSLSVCLFSPYAFKGSVSIPIWVSVFVGALSVDALLRYIVFGINSTLATVDLMATSICANFVLFDAVFVSGKLIGLQNILVVASMLRCVVAGQHSITYKRAIKPVPRKLVVEERPSSSKQELDLSYITSRIVAVSKSSFSTPEHVFLESKYANFLKCLPELESDLINPLSTIVALTDSAARHLLGNPVNVVSVITCPGDPNGVLVVCAVLLRMGSVYPRTARNALNLFIKQRYVIEPDRDSLLPKCLLSQLGILERRMTGGATFSENCTLFLKRVVVSNFHAEDAQDLRLSIVDVGKEGLVLEDMIVPSVSSTSLTFVCGATLLGEDSLLVFSSDHTTAESKLYVNTKHHFERIIASTSAFHFVSSFENCDHWAPWRFKNSSAQIELVASTESDNIAFSGKNRYDKALLQIPPFQQHQQVLLV